MNAALAGQVVTAAVTVQIRKKKWEARETTTSTATANNYKFTKLIMATLTSCHVLETWRLNDACQVEGRLFYSAFSTRHISFRLFKVQENNW